MAKGSDEEAEGRQELMPVQRTLLFRVYRKSSSLYTPSLARDLQMGFKQQKAAKLWTKPCAGQSVAPANPHCQRRPHGAGSFRAFVRNLRWHDRSRSLLAVVDACALQGTQSRTSHGHTLLCAGLEERRFLLWAATLSNLAASAFRSWDLLGYLLCCFLPSLFIGGPRDHRRATGCAACVRCRKRLGKGLPPWQIDLVKLKCFGGFEHHYKASSSMTRMLAEAFNDIKNQEAQMEEMREEAEEFCANSTFG